MIFLYQLAPKLGLVRGVHVVDIEDLGLRPNVLLRLPVAIDAPVHVQSIHAIHKRHFVHLPMARRASHSFAYVDTVVEVNVIGKIMDSCPFNGLAAGPAVTDGLGHRCIRPDLRVTRHARLCGRQTRKGGRLYTCVAVPAVDAVVLDVVLVTEWDRLFRGHPDRGDPRTAVHDVRYGESAAG